MGATSGPALHRARGVSWALPAFLVARMLGNVAIDGVVGAVPLVGDVFDVMWRSNRRKMRLLQEWLAAEERRGKKA
jgi:uncharacterized protein DUF4112